MQMLTMVINMSRLWYERVNVLAQQLIDGTTGVVVLLSDHRKLHIDIELQVVKKNKNLE
jgi:hypothetical protein